VAASAARGRRAAVGWSLLWVALALVYAAGLRWRPGGAVAPAVAFLTCYVVELSLSADNVAVMLAVFRHFRVKEADQPRVLRWGVIGAIVFRGVFVLLGAALLARVGWMEYVFAAILIIAALRMATARVSPGREIEGRIVGVVRRLIPVATDPPGGRFLVAVNGRRQATPLLLALVVIELGDIVFAVDSVPAAFAITRDPWLVYAANLFAIVGLRSLYVVLAGLVSRWRYLDRGLAMILLYVGATMAARAWVEIPTLVTLGVIAGVLAATAALSALRPVRPDAHG